MNTKMSEEKTIELNNDVLEKVTGGSGPETARFLDGKTVIISAKSNALGILLEPVTAKTLAEAINTQYGVSVSEHKIVLSEGIMTIGIHSFRVNVAVGVSTNMKALVK